MRVGGGKACDERTNAVLLGVQGLGVGRSLVVAAAAIAAVPVPLPASHGAWKVCAVVGLRVRPVSRAGQGTRGEGRSRGRFGLGARVGRGRGKGAGLNREGWQRGPVCLLTVDWLAGLLLSSQAEHQATTSNQQASVQ